MHFMSIHRVFCVSFSFKEGPPLNPPLKVNVDKNSPKFCQNNEWVKPYTGETLALDIAVINSDLIDFSIAFLLLLPQKYYKNSQVSS